MIVALTGGTGGAKLVEGLAAVIDPADLTIVGNTGDDCIFHGLHVSPDIDTIIYTLAGVNDVEKGWGIKNDTFTTLEQLRRLGNDGWFNLGDKDLATHITRTRLLNEGRTPSEITAKIRRSLGVRSTIMPMSDERVETFVRTPAGEISFQEFFVKEHWAPEVLGVRFTGVEDSLPAPGVIEAILRRRRDCYLSEQPGHQHRPDPLCAGNTRCSENSRRAGDRGQPVDRQFGNIRTGAQTDDRVRFAGLGPGCGQKLRRLSRCASDRRGGSKSRRGN